MIARSTGLNGLILRFVVNTAALVIAAYVLNTFEPGSIVIRDWQSAAITGAIFGLVNALIRPLVLFFTCLLQLMTLGLFTLVVNALMLLLTSTFAGALGIGFQVSGFGAAFFGALIISIVSTLLSWVLR